MTFLHRLTLALACLSLLTLAACHDTEPEQPVAVHPTSTPKPKPTPQSTQLPPDDQPAADAPAPTPKPRAEATPAAPSGGPRQTVDYPYGVPVEGKPGFVKSPYAPDTGYVDVRGFTPGQEARDPFTNKIFLVP